MTLTATGEAPDDFPGGYRLIRMISADGLAKTWEAEVAGGAKVAVHLFPDWGELGPKLKRFEALRRLTHPFLLELYDLRVWKDQVLIVSELADGYLQDRLKECEQQGSPSIPAAELIGYVCEAAVALDHLHAKGALYHDMKPRRLLHLRGHVKLESACLLWYSEVAEGDTTLVGTPAYMAPEVWRRQPVPASDQYGLAVSTFELRTGRWLFGATNLRELATSHLQGQPDFGPLPKAERSVLQKALAKEPGLRYPTCVEFAQALRQACTGIA
jgi:serine/threonine protein kinase